MMRLVLLCLVLVCGCGKKNEGDKTPVPIDQVPKELLEKAQKELPDVTFDSARKLSNGNLEIRGKNKAGKVREVEFDSKGKIVEIE